MVSSIWGQHAALTSRVLASPLPPTPLACSYTSPRVDTTLLGTGPQSACTRAECSRAAYSGRYVAATSAINTDAICQGSASDARSPVGLAVHSGDSDWEQQQSEQQHAKQLTQAIKLAHSWQELQQLAQDNESTLNTIHICAMLTKLAKFDVSDTWQASRAAASVSQAIAGLPQQQSGAAGMLQTSRGIGMPLINQKMLQPLPSLQRGGTGLVQPVPAIARAHTGGASTNTSSAAPADAECEFAVRLVFMVLDQLDGLQARALANCIWACVKCAERLQPRLAPLQLRQLLYAAACMFQRSTVLCVDFEGQHVSSVLYAAAGAAKLLSSHASTAPQQTAEAMAATRIAPAVHAAAAGAAGPATMPYQGDAPNNSSSNQHKHKQHSSDVAAAAPLAAPQVSLSPSPSLSMSLVQQARHVALADIRSAVDGAIPALVSQAGRLFSNHGGQGRPPSSSSSSSVNALPGAHVGHVGHVGHAGAGSPRGMPATVAAAAPGAQAASNTLYALAQMGHQPPGDWMLSFVDYLQGSDSNSGGGSGGVPSGSGRRSSVMRSLNPQHISNLVWAFAKLGYYPGDELLDALLVRAAALLPAFTPQGLCNVLWGLASLGYVPEGPATRALAALLDHAAQAGVVSGFNGQDVSNALWALARLAQLLPSPGAQGHGAQAPLQGSASAGVSLAAVDDAAAPSFAYGNDAVSWSDLVVDSQSQGQQGQGVQIQMQSQGGYQGHDQEHEHELVLHMHTLAEALMRRSVLQLQRYSAQALANCVWALSALRVTPPGDWLLAFEQASLACISRPASPASSTNNLNPSKGATTAASSGSGFSSRELAAMLVATARLNLPMSAVWTEQVLGACRVHAMRISTSAATSITATGAASGAASASSSSLDRRAAPTAFELANMLWACARLRITPPADCAAALLRAVHLQRSGASPAALAQALWGVAQLDMQADSLTGVSWVADMVQALSDQVQQQQEQPGAAAAPDQAGQSETDDLSSPNGQHDSDMETYSSDTDTDVISGTSASASSGLQQAAGIALWAAAHNGQPIKKALLAPLVDAVSADPAATPQAVANALWLLGKWRLRVRLGSMKALAKRLVALLPACSDAQLSMAVWGIAVLGFQPGRALVRGLVQQLDLRVEGFSAAHLACVVWSLAKCSIPVGAAVVRRVGARWEALRRAGGVRAGDVVQMEEALSLLSEAASKRRQAREQQLPPQQQQRRSQGTSPDQKQTPASEPQHRTTAALPKRKQVEGSKARVSSGSGGMGMNQAQLQPPQPLIQKQLPDQQQQPAARQLKPRRSTKQQPPKEQDSNTA